MAQTPAQVIAPTPALPEPALQAQQSATALVSRVNRQGQGGGGRRSGTVLGSASGLMDGNFSKKTLLGQ